MPRSRTVHRCRSCGWTSPRWVGRCGQCGAWNELVEQSAVDPVEPPPVSSVAVPLIELVDDVPCAAPTGVPELDRVLGGGLVPGSVTLVGGEPGIGKSTLMVQVAAASGRRVLFVSGEESAGQVRSRAARLGPMPADVWLVAETSLPAIIAHIDQVGPDLVVVDSIQTVHAAESQVSGTVAQIRDCTHRLAREAKQRSVSVVLVGHVTKDGSLAGPRVLEHAVDTVLTFDGDRHQSLRYLRAVKHRHGPTTEVGILLMGERGLEPVADPSQVFLGDRRPEASGSVVVPIVDGHRPLLVEVQALVVGADTPHPRRSAQGLDSGRLSLLLAVLERRLGHRLGRSDVYASTVGGVKLSDPGADAALALAVVSAHTGVALPADVVVVGEVGLGGELRRVPHVDRRLSEAARLGFRRAIVPVGSSPAAGIETVEVPTLRQAAVRVGLGRRAPEPEDVMASR